MHDLHVTKMTLKFLVMIDTQQVCLCLLVSADLAHYELSQPQFQVGFVYVRICHVPKWVCLYHWLGASRHRICHSPGLLV